MERLNPIVEAAQSLFDTLFQARVDRAVGGAPAEAPVSTVCVTVPLEGEMEGFIGATFPITTARRIASLFVGQDVDPGDHDLPDALCEIVGTIVLGARTHGLARAQRIGHASFSAGSAWRDEPPEPPEPPEHGARAWHAVPCTSELGEFWLSLHLSPAGAGAGAQRGPREGAGS